jgi:putative MFS transporter
LTVNAGARLDRLPLSSFHRRILLLIGIGMFFDGFDVYVAATVLGATLKTGFSTLAQNAQFVSVTFVGMMLGSFITGFLGDRYGRRFTYQANLIIFGLASVAAAFAPSMLVLVLLRGVMGLGLGAELVVGYAAMTEFVPPQARGKWVGALSVFVVTSLPLSALASTLIIPRTSWRAMFVLAGLGGLIVWYLRKALPESPRWLESMGRTEEAEAIMKSIEEEVAGEKGALAPPVFSSPAPPPRTAAYFFRYRRTQHRELIPLFLPHVGRRAGRLSHRHAHGRFLGPQAGHHRRIGDHHPCRWDLSVCRKSLVALNGWLPAGCFDLRPGDLAFCNLCA